ncbi:transcription factor IIA, alpha/beta subunit [Choiromyces venosus 120613-1]|uniref:Transcription factor IIA, alpha/beta subunit n=1 Tax=Choiromyces venosus 120613-1 TaxID=1336337 RepID=A0A3N4JRZ7_9PEZI|nr:transcription factor IIA, alpha/beta subunit [Choiromyces venosus 120613-1]
MSNTLVGEIYQRIIEEVIETSIIDFEEAGVNASTLQELKQVWQSKLSDLNVATFPWDPPSEATPPSASDPTPTKIQNNNNTQQQQQNAIKQEPGAQNPNPQTVVGVRIKPEPGTEPQTIYAPPAQPTGNPTHNPALAEARARQNLAQKFGNTPQLARPAGGLVLPGLATNPQQRPNGQQNGIPQHDGGNEETIPIEGFGNISRSEADKILLRRVRDAERKGDRATDELAEALKNLSSPKSSKAKRHRKAQDPYEEALDPFNHYPHAAPVPMVPDAAGAPGPSSAQMKQMDGESGDEEVVDEDAINSDLDDPEDDEIDGEDDDEAPQIMLCMYDKVQRTKNKWKCVLKDGVLTINQTEYVFHKANGEYEW